MKGSLVKQRSRKPATSLPGKSRTFSLPKTQTAVTRTVIRAAMKTAIPEYVPEIEKRQCRYCGRGFASDRIRRHEGVCLAGKRRKVRVFNSAKQRMSREAAAVRQSGRKDKPRTKWRQQHEEFIGSIRYARRITRAEAAGVDPRLLPAPAVSSHTEDYVQCPFCDRRFSQNVAERHVPKCRDIINRPKPPPLRPPSHTLGAGRLRSSSLSKGARPRPAPTCRGCGKAESAGHACTYVRGLQRLLRS